MIITVTGRIASINDGRMIKGNDGQQLPVIDFQLALDRGNYKKRVSLTQIDTQTGKPKEYDSDFYKVTIFGQSAISFSQYASKGREIQVSGRFVQEEYTAKDQLVQITSTNALFPYFAQLVGKVPEVIGAPDGNIYIKGNHPVNKTVFICTEYRWAGANPNAQTGGFANFQAPVAPNSFTSTGFAGAQGFSGVVPQTQGFAQQIQGFAPQQQAHGFVQGFNPQVQQQGFTQSPVMYGVQPQAQPANVGFAQGFTQQQNPQAPASYPGFGGESQAPTGFGEVPASTGGFSMPADDSASFANFSPDQTLSETSAQGFQQQFQQQFQAQTQPVVASQPVDATKSTVAPATNIPAPEKENKEIGTSENQGF